MSQHTVFIFFFLLWSCVFLPYLLLVFGCFFLLVFGYEMLYWSGYRLLLRSCTRGDDLIILGLCQDWVQMGYLFIGCIVYLSPHVFPGYVISSFAPGPISVSGFALCFGSMPSLWIDIGLELGSECNHLSGFNHWSSGFLIYASSEYVMPISAPDLVQLRIRLLGSPCFSGLLSRPRYGLSSFGLHLNCYCCWFFEGPIWGVTIFCCGKDSSQAQVFLKLKNRPVLWFDEEAYFLVCGPLLHEDNFSVMLICNSLDFIVSFWSCERILLGKDITPTTLLKVSRCCMFFLLLFFTISKACFGDS